MRIFILTVFLLTALSGGVGLRLAHGYFAVENVRVAVLLSDYMAFISFLVTHYQQWLIFIAIMMFAIMALSYKIKSVGVALSAMSDEHVVVFILALAYAHFVCFVTCYITALLGANWFVTLVWSWLGVCVAFMLTLPFIARLAEQIDEAYSKWIISDIHYEFKL